MSDGIPPPDSSDGSGSGPVAPVATLPLSEDTAPEVVPSLGSVIADKYRIEELIARGGMGAVFMATHLVSGKRVALKWMLPTLGQVPGAKERFVREAAATARIEHPNVIDIYDVGNDRGSVYLVMELLRGETLAEYLQRTPTVSPSEAVQLLMPALRGVAAAHAHHVIHRDLKPDNIFLCRSTDGEPREPRVLDFGISKIGGSEDARDLSLTRSGAVMGTPYYMSPEQVRGAKDVDERGDVYAFGVILYEMLTGQRPFDAETYNQLILKIATEDPPPIPALNPQVDRKLVNVVERAMARDPAARFPNIEALAVALEPFAAGALFRTTRILTPAANSGEHALRPAVVGRAARPARPARSKSRTFVFLGIALGCVGTAVGLWGLTTTRMRERAPAPAVQAPAAAVQAPAVQAPAAAVQVPAVQAPAPSAVQAAQGSVVPASAPAPASQVVPPSQGPETDVRAASKAPQPAAAASAGAEQQPGAAAPEPASEKPVVVERRVREKERRAKSSGKGEPVRRSGSEPAAAGDARPAAVRVPGAAERGKLPANWDDDLSSPVRPAVTAPPPAGRLDASDLR